MLIPMELLRKYVDINESDEAFVHDFSLKSAEVDSFGPFVSVTGLKVGLITAIKNHPDSDHLHITTVDTKDVVEDIVCGAPNVEVGRKVIVAKVGVKLPQGEMKKAIIRGVASNGMNCALNEIGVDSKFQSYEGIYYLDDNAKIGDDPVSYLHLNDNVLEIELTPNRQDLLSIIGVAYDAKAMMNSTMHLDFEKAKEKGASSDIKVSTLTPNCRAYYSKVIRNVKIQESPSWLKGDLMKMNIRPINNVVDITNYVLMVTGQPLHAFDYDFIKSKKIVVNMAHDGEKFTTLDNVERTLSKDDIVITDGEKPLCLGGVMGGRDSEVTASTMNIFLEAADFNPECIKNTSKRLGLQSESSLRFEKGINPELTTYALDLASKMLEDLALGEVAKDSDFFTNVSLDEKPVKVTLKEIDHVLGRTYSVSDVEKVFTGLSFKNTFKDGEFTVMIPKRRPDISTYQDLIEEVVRIDGYDKIGSTLPPSISSGHLTPYQIFERKVRHFLSNKLNEVWTYSLTTEDKATYFDQNEKEVVKIQNPLLSDRYSMRHSLIPSLLEVVKYNTYRKMDDCFIYEIGRSYELEEETPLLSGVLTGNISSTLWKGEKEKVDFFFVKGLLETLFNKLSVKNCHFELSKSPLKGMHPGVSALIICRNEPIGFIGMLHPDTAKYFEVNDAYVFELNLQKLFNASYPLKSVKEISKYPTMVRDLAFVVDESVTCQTLESEIQRIGRRSLLNIEVFDLYRGDNIGKGKKQIALSLTFGDMNRTLEAAEVDKIILDIIKHLESLGITLRE